MQEYNCLAVTEGDIIRHIFMDLSMFAVILVAVETLSNTAESDKTN